MAEGLREQLHAWERLVVGPAAIEPSRIRVPYTLVREGQAHTRELTFRWAAKVLDPRSDAHLASLIGVQIALNYALFCDELVLHGPFDRHDREFLVEMAHNTATEIFVNKLLKPNPYLIPGALRVEPVPDPPALCGAIRFPDAVRDDRVDPPFGDAVAVLSSGGKDSLVSTGICEELGLEPHLLFANESGRHWYTAMNAWRFLERTRPERTARVWTDCDRIYTFALRNLPFIRPDFDQIRADDYPIRLWTVAVFLFGTLPMLRARKVGTLLIGDEWDSTAVAEHAGIRHYCSLFDQSRFFDERLSAFFAARGWGVFQASLLRPLSELLIQEVLAGRYPELFAQQVSCHAASIKGERVVPCGRCEKCRRIVGMLIGLDRDPGVIGYPPEVVERCLAALAAKGAKQEEDGEHLAALLLDRGRIDPASPYAASARRHAGSDRLRFDPLRSPRNLLPEPLRSQTWRILLEHARGSLELRDGDWVEFDPLEP